MFPGGGGGGELNVEKTLDCVVVSKLEVSGRIKCLMFLLTCVLVCVCASFVIWYCGFVSFVCGFTSEK